MSLELLGTFFTTLIAHQFLRMALLAGCTASIASGVVGSYVVVKRIVFISGSIAHSVLGGMGINVCCGFIQKKKLGVRDECSSNQGALFLSARQRLGFVMHTLAKS